MVCLSIVQLDTNKKVKKRKKSTSARRDRSLTLATMLDMRSSAVFNICCVTHRKIEIEIELNQRNHYWQWSRVYVIWMRFLRVRKQRFQEQRISLCCFDVDERKSDQQTATENSHCISLYSYLQSRWTGLMMSALNGRPSKRARRCGSLKKRASVALRAMSALTRASLVLCATQYSE